MSDLLGVADDLYSLPVAEFTAARNAAAKQAKSDGDADLSAAITALRKPSTPAWVVNMMMRHQSEQMAQVLSLGESLRAASESLDGDALRELTRRRRQLTSAVTRQGRVLAAELGHRVTDDVARQVEDTLHAAMVDPDAAAAVRSGLLVSALAATGFGGLDVADAVAVPAAIGLTVAARPTPSRKRPTLTVVPDAPEADADRRKAQEAEQAAALAAADAAKKKLKKAKTRLAEAEALTLQLREEREEVRRRLAELDHEIERADEAAEEAEEKATRAAARYADAQEALDAVRPL